jgi:hypothetical protein
MKDKIHLTFKAFAQFRGAAASTLILRVSAGFTTRLKMQFLVKHPSDWQTVLDHFGKHPWTWMSYSSAIVWSPLCSPLMTWLILLAYIRMQTQTNTTCRSNGKLRCWNIRRHVPGSLWQLRCYTRFIRIIRMAQKITRQLVAYVNLI